MSLLVHLLMLAFFYGGSAEVVKDFEEKCGQFFANNGSPTKFNEKHYIQICQTLNGVYHYATFYDTKNRIPVYSAYRFNGINNFERADCWNIEPQLTDNNFGPNMALLSDPAHGIHQAINIDYAEKGYDRGHLAPVFHSTSQDFADATFTLTNAAPQQSSFNRGPWRALEGQLAKSLVKECIQNNLYVYIVTGVIQGDKSLNDRVNVPAFFWNAFCCLDNNKKCKKSGGHIGINEKGAKIIAMSVDDLEKKLRNLYKTEFIVFPKCK